MDEIELNTEKYAPDEVPDECPVCGCEEFTRTRDRRMKPPVRYQCTNCNYA